MNSDTDQTNELDAVNPDALRPEDELRLLKNRATLMGIPFSNSIGVDTLRARIEAKLSGASGEREEEDDLIVQPKVRAKTAAEVEQDLRTELKRTQMALVRCRIHNLNPAKQLLHGEIITVANRYLGTVRKFIPFGAATDNGYHIPRCLYDDLVGRKFQHIKTKTVNGQIHVERRIVPEYNIEVLPALNQTELRELALKQEAAKRLNGE